MISFKKKFAALSVFMPASAGCSNCRTKYTLLTREFGCPNCGLSFCKKCLAYKSHSRLDNEFVNVCYDCYQRGEQAKMKPKQLHHEPAPIQQPSASSSNVNWWGDNLPPPSLRQQIGPKPHLIKRNILPPPHSQPSEVDSETKELEKRFNELKREETSDVASVANIEERLAALRGCDVELIRNPRMWVSKNDNEMNAETPEKLMEQAKDLAVIEEKYDPDRELIARVKKLHEKDEAMETDGESNREDPRFSSISNTDSCVMNPDEQNQFNRMMDEAEQQSKQIQKQNEATDQEMNDIMKLSRQKSLEINKINMEFSQFWDKQINKTMEDEDSSDDDKELDEEMVKKIVQEAENTPDAPEPQKPAESPTKEKNTARKGFLGIFFKKPS